MKSLNIVGLRCSAKDYCFAVLCGSRATPNIIELGFKKFPVGFAVPERQSWFYKEILELFSKHSPKYVVVKADESTTKSNSAIERAYAEGVVNLAVGEKVGKSGCKSKRKVTIAKDLGLKGKAKYLANFDTSAIPKFDDHDDKMKEAILCAWSELG